MPAIGLKGKCRRLLKFPEEPARWQPPGVPDCSAGGRDGAPGGWADSWPPSVVSALSELVLGLTEEYVEDRMPLAEALLRLRAVGMGDSRFDAAQHHEDTDGSAEGDTAPGVGSGGIAVQPSDAAGSVMAQADDEERGRVTAL